jgi:hypothetical protein
MKLEYRIATKEKMTVKIVFQECLKKKWKSMSLRRKLSAGFHLIFDFINVIN